MKLPKDSQYWFQLEMIFLLLAFNTTFVAGSWSGIGWSIGALNVGITAGDPVMAILSTTIIGFVAAIMYQRSLKVPMRGWRLASYVMAWIAVGSFCYNLIGVFAALPFEFDFSPGLILVVIDGVQYYKTKQGTAKQPIAE